jgi:hypothetical protein
MLGLIVFFAPLMAAADTLTLYFYPSPRGMDWRSPHHLSVSILENSALPLGRSIGHASVELSCTGEEDGEKPFYDFTGVTGTTNDHRTNILEKGYAIGTVFLATPGHMEKSLPLKKERAMKYISGRLSYITAFINAAACRRAQRYLTEYRSQGYGSIYGGLMHEPRKKEGAGCTAFAKSFYDILGILDPELEQAWTTQVRVPEDTIGGPDVKRWVNFMGLYNNRNGKFGRWAEADEPHRLLRFWNPDKMYQWVNAVALGNTAAFDGAFEPVSRGNALGLVIDRRHVRPPLTALFMPTEAPPANWLASKLPLTLLDSK